MTARRTVPGAFATTRTIAALTLTRLLRGRTLWVSSGIVALPIVFSYLLQSRGSSLERMTLDILAFEQLVLAVLPALFVAASVGEEIEERTMTYLWSRPIPRWTVLAGKLVALVPIICALSVASWYCALLAGPRVTASLESCVALALGAVSLSLISAAIATLAPRYGMALAICYMLFLDLPVGVMPASLKHLSVTFNVRVIADVLGTTDQSATTSAITIGVITLVWTVVGLLRIRRLEA
jgi:ABC-type transport system involved in multi-copper enzyme maturation permease subunit